MYCSAGKDSTELRNTTHLGLTDMKHPVTAGRSSKFDLGLLLVLLPHCTGFRTDATEYSECIDHAPDLAVDKTDMYEKKRHY